MCSISGFTWNEKSLIKKMNKLLAYRGPDDNGIYIDDYICLGHNRLSIIDLTSAGHQPMTNKNGHLTIVFNGEVYNYKELRKILKKKGYTFNSNTDTEVVLNAFEEFGHKCLNMFNGMFAFAIWNSKKKELFLARDRIGIKPLYYYFNGENLIFSSEIKAIVMHNFIKTINLESLYSYLTYKFISSDNTIINGIKKLLPGHYLKYSNKNIIIKKYWDLNWNPYKMSERSCIILLDKILKNSVRLRLNSDVPLGAFLSGGLDSSLIVAINSLIKSDNVSTFTVGFNHSTDEFKYARKVSEYLNTDHYELVLDFKNITKKLPYIIWHMDEPNTDITMVPIYFLSEFAKKKVTVINTGEGADEIFSGYAHYMLGSNILKPIPQIFKNYIYSRYYPLFKKFQIKSLLTNNIKNKNEIFEFLLKKKSHYPKDFLNKILFFDIKKELPNWQLARVDRMTMSQAVEARVPFLDHHLIEFSTKLPSNFKQKTFHGKYILKKLALNYLPKDIIFRKKQVFTTPMYSWIKENLDIISEAVFFNEKKSFFNYNYINYLIEKHKSSKKSNLFQYHSFQLLVLLFFNIWYEMYINCQQLEKLEKIFSL